MTPDESRPQPQNWPAHRVLAALLLCLVIASGAAIVFLPIGWELNRFIVWLYYWLKGTFGITWLTIPQWDFALNALLFAVPAFLAKIAWPRVPVWLWLPFWILVSISIEAVQYFNLPRDASIIDITANSLGALVGLLAAAPLARAMAPTPVGA